MIRYAHPDRCPDCGAPITAGVEACARCALPLRGVLAQQLFTTLQQADDLLGRLRAAARVTAPAPASAVAGHAPAATPGQVAPPLPPAAPPPYPAAAPTTPRRSGLSAPSVPKILLGLGALCLMVAALVFLAVAWEVLGVQGRTVVVGCMTLAAGLGTGEFARRDLRTAAESFTAVTLGLLSLTVVGAERSGWLGDPSASLLVALVGAALLVAGYAAVEMIRRTPAGGAITGEVAVAFGAWLVGFGILLDSAGIATVLTVSVVVTAALALGAHRRGLRIAAPLLGAIGVLWWLLLTASGLERAAGNADIATLWGDLEVWPLLAAGVLVLVPSLLRPVPHTARVLCAAIAASIAAVVVALPASTVALTGHASAWLAILVVTAASAVVTPRPWRWVPVAPMLLSALLPGGVLVGQLGSALGTWVSDDVWHRAVTDRLVPVATPGAPGLLVPLLIGLVVAVAVTSTLALDPRPLLRRHAVPLAGVIALGGIATATLLGAPLLVVTLLLLALVGLVTGWAMQRDERWSAAAGALLGLALAGAIATPWTTALTLASAAAVGGVAAARGRATWVREAGEALLPAAIAGLLWTAGEIGSLDLAHRGVPILLLLGALVIARPRLASEVSAAIAATVAAIGATQAAVDPQAWTAIHLTLAGAVVSISALVNPQRRRLGWLGGLLLAMATWVRLEQIGVTAPEPYTLPSAFALLVVGLLHLRRRAEAETYPALLPGLGLALVPTLLWALADPVSWRALALAVACAVLVGAGVRLRWSAPVAAGAAVGGLLVLRHASPWIGATHPWIVIAVAGILLTVLGVTWESRLRDLRRAGGYLQRLR